MEDRLTADQQFTRRMLLERMGEQLQPQPQPQPRPRQVPVTLPEEAEVSPRPLSKANAIREYILSLGERASEENVTTVSDALRSQFPDITERDVQNAIRLLPEGSPRLARKPTVRGRGGLPKIEVPDVGPFSPRGRAANPQTLAIREYAISLGDGLADKTSADIVTELENQIPGLTGPQVLSALSAPWRERMGLPNLSPIRRGPEPLPPPIVIETGEVPDFPTGTSLAERLRRTPRPERYVDKTPSAECGVFYTPEEYDPRIQHYGYWETGPLDYEEDDSEFTDAFLHQGSEVSGEGELLDDEVESRWDMPKQMFNDGEISKAEVVWDVEDVRVGISYGPWTSRLGEYIDHAAYVDISRYGGAPLDQFIFRRGGPIEQITDLLDGIHKANPNIRIVATASQDQERGDIRARIYERYGWRRIGPTDASGSVDMELPHPEDRI